MLNICFLNVKLDQRLDMAHKQFKRGRERVVGLVAVLILNN